MRCGDDLPWLAMCAGLLIFSTPMPVSGPCRVCPMRYDQRECSAATLKKPRTSNFG